MGDDRRARPSRWASAAVVGLLVVAAWAVVAMMVGEDERSPIAAQQLPTAPPTFEVPTLPPDIPTPERSTPTATSRFSPTPSATLTPTPLPTLEPTSTQPPPTPTGTVTPSASATVGTTTLTPAADTIVLPRLVREDEP